MRTSARTSRPTTMSRPGANVRCQPPERTVIDGGSGRLMSSTIAVRGTLSWSRGECISIRALRKVVVPQGDYLLAQLRCRDGGRVDGIADVHPHRGGGVVPALGQHVCGAEHGDRDERHAAVLRQPQCTGTEFADLA